MPRNVTVTLADGSQHVYANAPDDITPDAVTARAQKDFGQGVTALDGGRPAQPAPAAPATVKNVFGLGAPPGPKGTPERATYDAEYNKRFNAAYTAANPQAAPQPGTAGFYASRWANLPKPQAQALLQKYEDQMNAQLPVDASQKQRSDALAQFYANPRVQGLRMVVGYAPVRSRKEEIAGIARGAAGASVKALGKTDTAMQAGVVRSLFGLPERVRAGEDLLLGTGAGNSYNDQLELQRAITDQEQAQSATGAVAGNVIGGLGAGGAAARGLAGVANVASRAGAAGLQGVARAGNILENLMTLRKGQALANAGKTVLTGAAAGGAQAAGEGSNPITGAAYGAGGAAILGGGFKAAQVVTRPFRDFLRLSSSGQILSRLTNETSDQLMARYNALRASTGGEPSLLEVLSQADRNRILSRTVAGRDEVSEPVTEAIRARGRALGPEMSARATEILQPQRAAIEGGLQNDLATARGGNVLPEDADLAAAAARSPTDRSTFRDTEADAYMAPHRDTVVVPSMENLFPSVPGPNGARMSTDPEAERLITSVAGSLRARVQGEGVTVGDVSDMIAELNSDIASPNTSNIDRRSSQRAIGHLLDAIDANAPEAGQAARAMNDAYAARSRMLEGGKAGAATQLRDDLQPGTSRTQARTIRNAYDTPEGGQGRALGQTNKILSDLGGSPDEALGATLDISRGRIGRQLQQNVGDAAAAPIIDAAQAQDAAASRLSAALNKISGGGEADGGVEGMVQALAGAKYRNPAVTAAKFWSSLRNLGITNGRARVIADMITSGDPDTVRRAINAVGNEKNGAAFMKYLAGVTGIMSAQAAPTPDIPQPDTTEPETPSETAAEPGEEAPAPDAAAAPTPVAEADSPYAPNLQKIYDTESPEMLDLISRVSGQESRGNQFDASGQPLTSSAGAIGAMQVMPGTAPEAARLAGVPFDDNAYRNDPAYNKLIGIAYLSELLRKYDGDVVKALAAYNAGPTHADKEMSGGGDWLSRMPAETQDYVQKIS